MFPETSGKLFGNFFVLPTSLSQMKLQDCYTFKKCKFTAVNKGFTSTNSGKFPWGNFLRRKIPRKIFLTILPNFGNFSDRGIFLKIPGEISGNFMYKKHNLPAVNKGFPLVYTSCPQYFRKLSENFSGNCLSYDNFDINEIIRMLPSQKVKFCGCKQTFCFDTYRKVPLRNFLWRKKNPSENISDSFGSARKVFRQGALSENFVRTNRKF